MAAQGQTLKPSPADAGTAPALEAVFEALLAGILRGDYGSRLPAERELARQLGASRATVRGALSRLTAWGLVAPRRGSGVVVRDRREWSIEVLPAYLRHAPPGDTGASMVPLLRDLLALRRTVILSVVELVAGRVAGRLDKAREALSRAWAARGKPEFTVEDFEVIRAIVEAAQMWPAVWMLNDLSGIYLEIARTTASAIPPRDDYVDVHEQLFEALEAGRAKDARAVIEAYLDSHDAQLVALLEMWG